MDEQKTPEHDPNDSAFWYAEHQLYKERVTGEIATVNKENGRLRSDLEEAQFELHTLKEKLKNARTAVKLMGWRLKDCTDVKLREAHNGCIRDLLAILDGDKGVVAKYDKGAK